jgi:hypothetical protein
MILTAALCVIVPLQLHRFTRRNEANSTAHKKSDWDRWRLSLPPIAGQSVNSRSTGGRTVYPYSVVPGGVRDSQGLREAVSGDPVVAAHYVGFKLARARVVRLGAARTAYVSYRLGKKVYWTRNKVKLAAGEKVITDGKNFARARCGNRFTETSGGETSPDEPTPDVLDRPVDPPGPEVTRVPWIGDPSSVPNPGLTPPSPDLSSPPDLPVVVLTSPGPPPVPPVFIPPFVPPPVFPNPSDAPPAPVPEPSTILLFTSGLGAWFAIRRKFTR